MRSSSLANNPLAITRELDGRYDVVLEVRDNLDLITQVSGIDFAAILAELESAQDFTGITVVQGKTVAWDAVNKILTVPKGDKGDKGDTGLTGPQGAQGIQGPQGIKGDTGLKGDTGSQGPKGFDGAAGAQGPKGDTGDDLTISQITYNGNGTFNWLFSDGTVYVTPSLKGPKGDTGDQGVKGDQGISVHHIKGTSTTDLEGDFGAYSEIDTYTVYGDANETINLGFFRVNNGAAKEGQHGLMYKSTYDTTANGIVDNSEKLEGRTIAQIQADITDTIGASNGIASLDATTKLERAQVPTMNVTLEGDVSGNFAVDGSLNTRVNVVVQDNSHSHTFSNLTAKPTTLSGYGITDATPSSHVGSTGTAHDIATTSVNGFMSSTDKSKLNGIAANANNYVHPTSGATVGTYKSVTVDANGHITTGTNPTTVSGYGLTDVYTKTENNASLALKVNNSEKGVANGIATLDNNSKVVLTQIPDSLLGQLEYMGIWNFATLPTATEKGQYWIVSVSGNGYEVGDWAVWNGSTFDKVDNTDAVATVAGKTGNVVLTKSDVGLDLVDNTADASKNVLSATKWAVARTVTLSGDVAGSVSIDGSANVTLSATVQPNSVALGTDTTGNYVAGNTAGTGIVVTGTAGEGWSPTISLTNTGTSGTYRSVTTDAQGRVTSGTNPTTVSGYGLTDVYTKTEVNSLIPTTLPASDVYAWAKVATKPTYTASEVGLGNVTNESKSTMFTSPTFTGTPVASTAAVGTNTTQIATTAYVIAEINKIEEW